MKKIIHIMAAVLLVIGVLVLAWRVVQYRQNRTVQYEAQKLAGLPTWAEPQAVHEPEQAGTDEAKTEGSEESSSDPSDPYAQALAEMDFTALQAVNSEIQGWIVIPGTDLSYPLLQGADNHFYLTHNWKGEYNAAGSIFLDCGCDLSGFNTIVYGHRMRDGSMFGTLKEYQDAGFWQAHPDVYLVDGDGSRRYAVFAAWEAGLTDAPYWTDCDGDEERQAFISSAMAHSVLDTGIVPETDDCFLTLSTCTGSGHKTRWVVQAVLREDDEV